ncbi:hypothetical protein [Streptomyces anandii]|uniref:hypothetical protein n=1 Tax=Streptomyces anandii TaxID=285454 RepID=UPI0036C222FC
MIAMLMVLAQVFGLAINAPVIAMAVASEVAISEEAEWEAYHAEAYAEYADEFTALFNSYEVKRAKNGAMMIRRGNSGSYKFCKKSA